MDRMTSMARPKGKLPVGLVYESEKDVLRAELEARGRVH